MSVALPPNVKTKAWIAVNIYLYYNKANEFLGYIKQQCNCPSMTIARKYEYLWADGSTVKTPINLPAIDYAGHVMLWIEGYLDDPTFFPEKDGKPPPIPNISHRIVQAQAICLNSQKSPS